MSSTRSGNLVELLRERLQLEVPGHIKGVIWLRGTECSNANIGTASGSMKALNSSATRRGETPAHLGTLEPNTTQDIIQPAIPEPNKYGESLAGTHPRITYDRST